MPMGPAVKGSANNDVIFEAGAEEGHDPCLGTRT